MSENKTSCKSPYRTPSPLPSTISPPSSLLSLDLTPLPRPNITMSSTCTRRTNRYKGWNGLSSETITNTAIKLSAADWSRCSQVSFTWRKLWWDQIQRFKEALWNRFLPELVPHVAQYLNPSDRASCQLVPKSWRLLWYTYLWDQVTLRDEHSCFQFDRQAAQVAFNLNRKYLTSFSTRQGYDHGSLLLSWSPEDSPDLQKLELNFPHVMENAGNISSLDLLVPLLKRFSQLRHLSLSGNLERLRSPDRAELSDPRAWCILYWIRSESLESLFIDNGTRAESHHHQSWSQEPTISLPGLPSLRHLSLSGSSATEELLLPYLQRCPHLEVLEIHKIVPWRAMTFLTGLKDAVPLLVKIIWIVPGLTDEILTQVLGVSSLGWREITLGYSGTFGRSSLDALMRHSSTIESFVVEGLDGICSAWIQEFLQSSPRLKRFQGLNLSRPREHRFDLRLNVCAHLVDDEVDEAGNTDEITDAKEDGEMEGGEEGELTEATKNDKSCLTIASTSTSTKAWACRGLEFLALKVDGMHRKDVTGNDWRATILWHIADQEQKDNRQVYRQLGALTNLRELMVSHGLESQVPSIRRMMPASRHMSAQSCAQVEFNCISFSLASGLYYLAGLKKLVLLDVSCTAHKIRVPELSWMNKHWPLLKVIIGLLDSVGVQFPDKTRIQGEKDVLGWLQLHPNGIGWYYDRLAITHS